MAIKKSELYSSIWKSCDELRGGMDASQYKDYVLVLLFVKQHVCIIRSIPEKLSPQFLSYFLLSTAGQRQIDSFQAGGNRQGLNFGQIRSFRL
ncbi:MAG: type I restriction-modification system subunit M N-terminal domain-containing protein, partial [Anaerolineae bacterium]